MTTAIRGVTGPRFVSDVVAAACGHWPELLAAVGIDIPPRGKHGPCPVLSVVAKTALGWMIRPGAAPGFVTSAEAMTVLRWCVG